MNVDWLASRWRFFLVLLAIETHGVLTFHAYGVAWDSMEDVSCRLGFEIYDPCEPIGTAFPIAFSIWMLVWLASKRRRGPPAAQPSQPAWTLLISLLVLNIGVGYAAWNEVGRCSAAHNAAMPFPGDELDTLDTIAELEALRVQINTYHERWEPEVRERMSTARATTWYWPLLSFALGTLAILSSIRVHRIRRDRAPGDASITSP